MQRSEQGFTIMELLVTLSILSILTSVALTHYQEYTELSFDARAISDLRNTISAQEAQFVDTEAYVADVTQLVGFDHTSPAVTLILAADANSWRVSSYHPKGTKTYCFDSSNNLGIIELPGVDSSCS